MKRLLLLLSLLVLCAVTGWGQQSTLGPGRNLARGWITPYDFGAVGDSVTDDTAALQSWLNYGMSNNVICFLPPARSGGDAKGHYYSITKTLMITNAALPVTVMGCGGPLMNSDSTWTWCRIAQATVGKDAIFITNNASHIELRDFMVSGPGQAACEGAGNTCRGIAFDGYNDNSDCVEVSGVAANGFTWGFWLSGIADAQFRNCCPQNNAVGVICTNSLSGFPGPVINNISFVGCQISYNWSNELWVCTGTIKVQDSDIAQAQPTTTHSVGCYVTGGTLTLDNVNSENDTTKGPCVVVQGLSAFLEVRGGHTQGANAAGNYSLINSNGIVKLHNWNAQVLATDDSNNYAIEYGAATPCQVSSDTWFTVKEGGTTYIFNVALLAPQYQNSPASAGPSPFHAQLTSALHSPFVNTANVSQGGNDNIDSLMWGGVFSGNGVTAGGTQPVDLLAFYKGQQTCLPVGYLAVTNSIMGNSAPSTLNTAGGNLTLQGGESTGTAKGGAIVFQTVPSGSSGLVQNTATATRTYIAAHEVPVTKSSATLVFNLSLASGNSLGARVYATTRCNNGTDFQTVSDTFVFAAVNKAGTVTPSTVSTVTSANAVSTGTITDTWTVVANGNGVDVKCNAVPSLTPGTLATTWRVEVDSTDTGLTVTAQ